MFQLINESQKHKFRSFRVIFFVTLFIQMKKKHKIFTSVSLVQKYSTMNVSSVY